jgi:hypothetical protein
MVMHLSYSAQEAEAEGRGFHDETLS